MCVYERNKRCLINQHMYHLTTCFSIFHKPIQTAIQIKSCLAFSNIKYVTHKHIQKTDVVWFCRFSWVFHIFIFIYIYIYCVCVSVSERMSMCCYFYCCSLSSPFLSFRLLLTLSFCSSVRFSVYSTIFIGIFISATNRSRLFCTFNLVSMCIFEGILKKKKINSTQNKDNI